jgi:putative transcriptional regulator
MTCVLSGSFSHEGGHYGPGDFDLGDETMDHQVLVDPAKIASAWSRCRVIFG